MDVRSANNWDAIDTRHSLEYLRSDVGYRIVVAAPIDVALTY